MKWVTSFVTDKCDQQSNDDMNENENGGTKVLKAKPLAKSKVVRKGRFQSIIGTTEDEEIDKSDEKRKKQDMVEAEDEEIDKSDEKRKKQDMVEAEDEEIDKSDEKRKKQDMVEGRCSEHNASFVSLCLASIVNNSLNCLSLSQFMQLTWLFSAISTINGLPVTLNGTEPSYNIQIDNPVLNFKPVPIIVNEQVRLTCQNSNPIDDTLPFTWSKIRSNGEKEIIAINNNPSSHTKDKYKFRLSNDNKIMELDIVRFGMTDFCEYICEIGYRKGSLNLTSKSEFLKYLSFPQQVQPILGVKGLTLEVMLDLEDVYPLPIATLMTEEQDMRLDIKTIDRLGIFYAVRLYGNTTISACPQNEKTHYFVKIELIEEVKNYTGTTNTICSEHGGKGNEGIYLMFSPMVLLLCVLGPYAWTQS